MDVESYEPLYDNVKRMLFARGYDEHPCNDFKDNALRFVYDEFVILVYINKDIKININLFEIILKKALTAKAFKCIIVHEYSFTPDAKLGMQVSKIVKFETFTVTELSINLPDLIPAHKLIFRKTCEICTSEKRCPICDALPVTNLKECCKYPIILATDRAARYYGYGKNDVVSITENGVVSYRLCK